MKLNTIYIGYFQNIVLCASDDKHLVSKYLKKIRGLQKGEYTIYSLTLNSAELEAMYGDLILEEYDDGVWLTARDISILDEDVYNEFIRFTEMINSMKAFAAYAEAGNVSIDTKVIHKSITQIMKTLTKGKSVDALRNGIEVQSPVFSKNLTVYLNHVGYWTETAELREMFLTKLNDERS